MYSTFAGTLSSLGRDFAQACDRRAARAIGLLNASQRITDTLANLGVIHLFQRLEQTAPDATEFKPVEAVSRSPDRKEVAQAMLEAHRTLVEINPANFEKFKDVLNYLAEDLKKLEGEPQAGAPQPEA